MKQNMSRGVIPDLTFYKMTDGIDTYKILSLGSSIDPRCGVYSTLFYVFHKKAGSILLAVPIGFPGAQARDL